MKILWYKVVYCLLCLCFYATAYTQEAPADPQQKTVFQFLQSFDEIVITTDLDSLVLNKYSNKKQEACLSIDGAEVVPLHVIINLKPRGRFRRRTCELPPVKIDFKKSDLKRINLIHDYDALKIVTVCTDEPDRNLKLVKEFWTYRMYNRLTPESFQVHPFRLTYIDSKDSTRTLEMQAFIIESDDELAERLGGKIVDQLGSPDSVLEKESYHRTILFNYMIGNTDWDIKMARNVKLIQKKGADKLTVVPYDFDFSALVQPSYFYLVPSENPKLIQTNRVALGTFSDADALEQLSQTFLKEKDEGLRCYRDCPVLPKDSKKQIDNYLHPFFKLLKKKKRLKREFLYN